MQQKFHETVQLGQYLIWHFPKILVFRASYVPIAMAPISMSCRIEVVFGGRNIILMFSQRSVN